MVIFQISLKKTHEILQGVSVLQKRALIIRPQLWRSWSTRKPALGPPLGPGRWDPGTLVSLNCHDGSFWGKSEMFFLEKRRLLKGYHFLCIPKLVVVFGEGDFVDPKDLRKCLEGYMTHLHISVPGVWEFFIRNGLEGSDIMGIQGTPPKATPPQEMSP